MKNNYIELFVPGRLCLVGEHSDWAGKYRSQNNNIEKGYAIVTGINEGIYAKVKTSNKLIIKNNVNHTTFTCDIDYKKFGLTNQRIYAFFGEDTLPIITL